MDLSDRYASPGDDPDAVRADSLEKTAYGIARAAAAGGRRDTERAAFEEPMRRGESPAPGEIAATDLVDLLRAAGA